MRVFIGENEGYFEKDRIEKIKIHDYDVDQMDDTLATIILPMLKLLKDRNAGSLYNIDNADLPEELRKTEDEPDERVRGRWVSEYDDELNYDRWNWVLDEMIWAFEQKVRDSWVQDYTEIVEDNTKIIDEYIPSVTKYDNEGMAKHQARMTRGFAFFGKYFENLWI